MGRWFSSNLISNLILAIHSKKEARTTIRSIKIQAFITLVYYMAMSQAPTLEDSWEIALLAGRLQKGDILLYS